MTPSPARAAHPTPGPEWAAIALMLALLLAGPALHVLPALWQSPWLLIEDDGRHFVAWLRKLADPALFPADPMERFFASVTPDLYRALYAPALAAGIDVVRWHLLVLVPATTLLGLLALDRLAALFVADRALRLAVFAGLALELQPLYALGLPRDFALPIVGFALWAYATDRRWALAALIGLGAALYPAAAITAGVGLACAEALRLATGAGLDRARLATLAIAAVAGALGLGWFLSGAADFGPTIRIAEAQGMPIFQHGGRTAYFTDTRWERIFCGDRAGLLLTCGQDAFWWLGIPLAALVIGFGLWRVARAGQGDWRLLAGLCLGGGALFAVASVVAFAAHLPSRYALWSVQLVYLLCLAILVGGGLLALARRVRLPAMAVPLAVTALFVASKAGDLTRMPSLLEDPHPALSEALRALPPDTLVAGTDGWIDSVPAVAARPVLASIELSVPYKRDYYREMARRVALLARLYGETDPARWLQAHAEAGADVYVVRDGGVRSTRWARSFPEAPQPGAETIFGARPEDVAACTLASGQGLALVDGACFASRLAQGA